MWLQHAQLLNYNLKVRPWEWSFVFDGRTKTAMAASNRPFDKIITLMSSDVGEKQLQLLGYAWKVGVDRVRLDKSWHVDCNKTESFFSGFNREMVKPAESDIRVECRCISEIGWFINRETQRNGTLMNEVFHWPFFLERLSRPLRKLNHFLVAPSISWGGSKDRNPERVDNDSEKDSETKSSLRFGSAIQPLMTLLFTDVADMHPVTHSVIQDAETLIPLIAGFILLVWTIVHLYFTHVNHSSTYPCD